MADRNVTFLILAKDFASRTLKNVGDSSDRAAQKLRNLNTLGLGPVATAGAALGPALLPVMGAATVAAVGMGTALASAGASVGVFGAVTKTAFTEVSDASTKLGGLRDKVRLLNKEIAIAPPGSKLQKGLITAHDKAVVEYQARVALLPAPLRNTVRALNDMKDAWQDFVDKNKPAALGFLTKAFNVLAAAVPKLQPLFNVAATAAGGLANSLGRFVSGGGMDRMVAFLTQHATPALNGFIAIARNVGTGLAVLFGPVAASTDGVVSSLTRLTASFATWAQGKGQGAMTRLMDGFRTNGPKVMAVLGSLATSIKQIAQAAGPLAPVSLAVAAGLSRLINALPQGVLTTLIGSFIAFNVALRAAAVGARLMAAIGVLGGIFTGVTAAVTGNTLADNSNTAAKVANKVVTLAIAGATKVWTGAQWLLNAALNANPIGLVVVALVLLVGGLIYAYKHSEKFRAVVQAAMHGVLAAAKAVGGFFAAWPAFFSAVWKKITGGISAAASWIGGKLSAIGGWFKSVPGAVKGAFASAGTWLLDAGRQVIMGLVQGIGNAASAAVGAAKQVASNILGGVKSFFGINSPSTVFRDEVGMNIILGVAEGVKKGSPAATAKTKKAMKEHGFLTMSGYIAGIKSQFPAAKAALAAATRYVAPKTLGQKYTGGLNYLKRAAQEAGQLQVLTDKRAKVADKLKAANKKLADAQKAYNDYRSQVASGLTTVSGVTSAMSFQGVTDALQTQLTKLQEFQQDITALRKKGLNKTTLQQLIDGGLDSLPAATSLANADSSALAYVNQLQGQVTSAGNGIGKTAADTFYGAGVNAAKGLVRGLQSQQASLTRQMNSYASALVKSIRKALGIRSPSTVFAKQVGRWIPAGIGAGITGGTKALVGTMSDTMGAVLGAAGGSIAGPLRSGFAGSQVLQPIQLVVEGKVLAAVLLKVKRDNGNVSLGLA